MGYRRKARKCEQAGREMETHWGLISVKKAELLYVPYLCSLHFVDLIPIPLGTLL